MKRILFICTGNTCRSPLAEGLAKKMAFDRGLSPEIESAGLSVFPDGANPHSITVAAEYGADLTKHRARPLTDTMLLQADQIYTMTKSQADFLKRIYPSGNEKIKTLCDQDVSDPYGGSEDDYRLCAQQIWEGLQQRWEEDAWD